MIRILVADDHAVVRQGLCRILALAADFRVEGEAANGREVLEFLREGRPDLLLLDMNMPGPSGIDLIKRICRERPGLPVLVLSMHDESQMAIRAIKAGARGYLTKDSNPEAIIGAIRRVAAGGNAIDPDLAARLLFEPAAPAADAAHRSLSDREYQVLVRLARGEGINDIAATLHLSPKTISTHKSRLMQKLGLESNADLVRYALRHGLADS